MNKIVKLTNLCANGDSHGAVMAPLIDRFSIICLMQIVATKSSTPSFILELPVKTDDSQTRILQKRFEAARQIYNACLGESMRRLNLIRQSKTYQKARKIPKGKERSQLFKDLNLHFGYTINRLIT